MGRYRVVSARETDKGVLVDVSKRDGGWMRAEQLARRINQLTAVPMRSENHPTWDPVWRRAIEEGLCAIGSGDEDRMERALTEIEHLARTL